MNSGSASDEISEDLAKCEDEPIHIPGAIQPHGALLVLQDPDARIVWASANAEEFFGQAASDLLNRQLPEVVDSDAMTSIVEGAGLRPHEWIRMSLPAGAEVEAVAHRDGDLVIVEFERLPNQPVEETRLPWNTVREVITTMKDAQDIDDLCARAAQKVRAATGFGRVKVYRFDDEWNGLVVAEDRADDMVSYLGLHFPATDIPAQARRLYSDNRIRIIPRIDYEPVPIVSCTDFSGKTLDMSHAILRSVSPVHLEYLRNMDVGASMSVSVIRDGKLWGLIACHHPAPLYVSHTSRSICAVVAEVLSLLLGTQYEAEAAQQSTRIREAHDRLLDAMLRSSDIRSAMSSHETDVLSLAEATGAALITEDDVLLMGRTPGEADVIQLGEWVRGETTDSQFATSCLPAKYHPAKSFSDVASGLLVVSLSRLQRHQIMWFRPEEAATVVWAGNPKKAVSESRDGTAVRLHPRDSFEQWKEIRQGVASEWSQAELTATRELRSTITDVVLVQAARLEKLNARLARANAILRERNNELQEFAFVASHDLQEPLRKIRAFSELMREEYIEAIDETGQYYLDRMHASAERMSSLISDLLEYSRIATHGDDLRAVELDWVIKRVLNSYRPALEDVQAHLDYDADVVRALPRVHADPRQLQRLFQSLIDNSLKFCPDDRAPFISIRADALPGDNVIRVEVEDNGSGFHEKYLDRIFLPFEQLSRRRESRGTGIGLAIAKRIVTRHGGEIGAYSRPGEGSTFFFTIPVSVD